MRLIKFLFVWFLFFAIAQTSLAMNREKLFSLIDDAKECGDFDDLQNYFFSEYSDELKIILAAVWYHYLHDQSYLKHYKHNAEGSPYTLHLFYLCYRELTAYKDPNVVDAFGNYLIEIKEVLVPLLDYFDAPSQDFLKKWLQDLKKSELQQSNVVRKHKPLPENPWSFTFSSSNYSPPFSITYEEIVERVYGDEPPCSIPQIEKFNAYHAHYGTQKYIEAEVLNQRINVMGIQNGSVAISIDGKPHSLDKINLPCDPQKETVDWLISLFYRALSKE